MNIKEINAKSILRKQKKIDSWFITHYGMNLYRGCVHNCVYCDGRAERYYVDGEFGRDIQVKINAIEILDRELNPARKRIPFKRSFLMPGGGVGDSYQPVEKKYDLTRKTLELAYKYNFPVHLLTKSTNIKRDIEIIEKINEKQKVIISFSFSTVDENVSAIFEPGVPPPSERLKTISYFKSRGIACGIFLMPVIPFISDTPEQIDAVLRKSAEIGIDYLIFGGMTLKEGRQKDYFYNILKNHYPNLVTEYDIIYRGDRWGGASTDYYTQLHYLFNIINKKYKIPTRIPPYLYRDILSKNDLVIVMLEHIDYFLKNRNAKSPYGYAAYSISQLKEPLSEIRNRLRELKGVGKVTERLILEILDTGDTKYYNHLSFF